MNGNDQGNRDFKEWKNKNSIHEDSRSIENIDRNTITIVCR